MEYIYKLLDEQTKEKLVTENLLSLSRPFFVFCSENKRFKILKQINRRIEECSNIDDITPTEAELNSIKAWIDEFYNSIPENHRNCYSPHDICSDLRIAMTVYVQTYCGYCTRDNLDDKNTLKNFVKSNCKLSAQKIAYAKIPISENNLDKLYWSANDTNYIFECDEDQSYSTMDKISGTLHIHTVEYVGNNELISPFKKFNTTDERKISSFLKYVDDQYNEQSEERIMLRLASYRKSESVVAFNNLYSNKQYDSLEEMIFYNMVSILFQAKKYPEYVYLKLNEFSCNPITF